MMHPSLLREGEALAAALTALRWYANEDHWSEDDWGVPGVIDPPDYGKPGHKARLALKRVQRILTKGTK